VTQLTTQMQTSEAEDLLIYGCFGGLAAAYAAHLADWLQGGYRSV
jgi:hypothetical protein